MSEASIHRARNDRIEVSGVLSFTTVPDLRADAVHMFAGAGRMTVDLGGVSRSDSAGLALMIEWLREARRRKVDLRFAHVPDQIRHMAQVSSLEDILPMDG